MTKLKDWIPIYVVIALLALSVVRLSAQPGTVAPLPVGVVGTVPVTVPTTDPCQSPSVAKSSAVLNFTATAQVVALSGTTKIYVCHLDATLAGTSPTLQLEYGTGAVCATGTTVLTGTYIPTVGTEINFGYGGTVISTAAGNALCVVLAGTTPSLQGVLVYVQQ